MAYTLPPRPRSPKDKVPRAKFGLTIRQWALAYVNLMARRWHLNRSATIERIIEEHEVLNRTA